MALPSSEVQGAAAAEIERVAGPLTVTTIRIVRERDRI
jgi:hypothetical protein